MANKSSIKDDLIDKLNQGAGVVAEEPGLANPEDGQLEIGEGQVGKEFRSELVCKDDVAKIIEYDKEQLQKYAHSRLGKKLDLNKRIKQLKTEVIILIKNKLDMPIDTDRSNINIKEAPVSKNPEFIFNPANRRIFEYTEILSKRTELIPCYVVDEEGKRL